MRLHASIPMTYPDGPDQPPVCTSGDVIAEYDPRMRLADFMRSSLRERRKGLAGSRSKTAEFGPLHLYKYRPLDANSSSSINKARAILVHDRIWVAAPGSLNDPRDMRFKLVFNQDVETRKQWVKDNAHLLPRSSPAKRLLRQQQLARTSMTPEMEAGFKRDMEQNMGVFCASTDPRSRQLWAHYGGEHRGVCIQLSPYEDELFLIAKQVIYGEKFPTLTVPAPAGAPQEHYLHKSSDWSYEKEWRVVLPINNCSITLRPPAITAVILGARVDATTVDAVLQLQHERQQIGKPPFKIYQAGLDDEGFDIHICCRNGARVGKRVPRA